MIMQTAPEIFVHSDSAFCTAQCPVPLRTLKKLLYAMLEGSSMHALTLHLVRDARIIEENLTHMHCQSPTNILSFPASFCANTAANEDIPHILMLSIDTLQRECLLYGQTALEHAIRLLAHGIGHLLGYDHGAAMWQCCQALEAKGHTFLEGTLDSPLKKCNLLS